MHLCLFSDLFIVFSHKCFYFGLFHIFLSHYFTLLYAFLPQYANEESQCLKAAIRNFYKQYAIKQVNCEKNFALLPSPSAS